MSTADNAQIYYESGVTPSTGYVALTDTGDNTIFRSAVHRWSNQAAYKPTVRPDGLYSGGVISVGTGDDNAQITAGKVYIAGALISFAADTSIAVTRGVGADVCMITSILVNNAGVISSLAGTDGATIVETRGAAGGPPLITVGLVELGQVRTTATVSAPITTDEIYSTPGVHTEWYNYPGWTINYSRIVDKESRGAGVTFDEALPDSHVGSIPKAVYADYCDPKFSKIGKCTNFVPIETSWSTSSTQIYDGKTIGASSSSLGQGAFTAYMEDNITDLLIAAKNKNLWFKWLQDSSKTTIYVQTQGRLGIARTSPPNDNLSLAATISGEAPSDEVTSEATL